MEKLEKLENLYQEFWEDEFKKNGMHNPAKFIDTQPFMYRSKELGFIKWLVDNNKIDRLTFCTIETPSSKYEDFDLGPETPREDYTNILLMDLALQENPIEFLISILR